MAVSAQKEPKNNGIIGMFSNMWTLLNNMVNLKDEVDENTVDEAIKKTKKSNPEISPEELDKTGEELKKEQSVEKNYNELENKLGNIKAEVDEKKAQEQTTERPKGEKQVTRVDED